MAKYAIFQVYDYKGGELSSSTNMSLTNFIGSLSEKFENALYDFVEEKRSKTEQRNRAINTVVSEVDINYEKQLLEETKEAVLKALKSEDFFSTYAGGDGFSGELYKIEGDTMSSVSFKSFSTEIAQYITDIWILEKDYRTYTLEKAS